ncbi:MAG: GNAT family N-acetyltransferase [Cyclobacteriaceae bacterium]
MSNNKPHIKVRVANSADCQYAQAICDQIEESAKARGTGIAKRSVAYIENQINSQKSIIAIDVKKDEVAGFCYIESWGHQKYAANSGLIVFPNYRKLGLARRIKEEAFKLSRKRFPLAKLFGLTTSLAVMKINSEIGYHPVTYSELTTDEEFWKGCQSCVNYEILQSKERKNCICTAMLFDPTAKKKKKKWTIQVKESVYERWKSLKLFLFTKNKVENK